MGNIPEVSLLGRANTWDSEAGCLAIHCSNRDRLKSGDSECLSSTNRPWRNPASAGKMGVKIDTNMHMIYWIHNNSKEKYGLLVVSIHGSFSRRKISKYLAFSIFSRVVIHL